MLFSKVFKKQIMKYGILVLLLLVNTTGCTKKKTKEEEVVPGDKTENIAPASSTTRFSAYLGVNSFEWEFLIPQSPETIDETKFALASSFSGIRHYLDWERIEQSEGSYTFSPAHAGGWDYDLMYQRIAMAGMDLLVDLKTCPSWLQNTYPENERDAENVPAPYGLNRSDPSSYSQQAKAGFQLAARYGSNKNIDPGLVSVNRAQRWTGDRPNTAKIGLGLVKYIECDNERDKWWKGSKAQQSAEEYAANMSAFYDGHKGKLGKNAGVKTADPNMKVVMGGLANPDPKFVVKMIAWCKANRGYKPDGSVDLCFDIINYHLYSNNASTNGGTATVGIAPELSELGSVATAFVKMSKEYAGDLPVWVTETGYDVGAHTPQRAIAIGSKNAQLTQADWNLRTSFLYARKGIKQCTFYMLNDVDLNSWTQYTSSGFMNADMSRRPSADYILQTKNLLGNYFYHSSLSSSPVVDLYVLDNKKIFVLYVPDQKGKTVNYELSTGSASQVIIHTLQVGKNNMSEQTSKTANGKITISVSETPVFVEVPANS